MTMEASAKLARDRVARMRRKWMMESRPPAPMAHALLIEAAVALAEVVGPENIVAALETFVGNIREGMAGSPDATEPPASWWSKLNPWRADHG